MTIQIMHDLEHRWLKILCVDGSGSCEHSNWIWCLFIGVEVAAQKRNKRNKTLKQQILIIERLCPLNLSLIVTYNPCKHSPIARKQK